ncbi:hypothetical protein ACFOSC_15330 [Streptantibioticus rubrisoli]|uniref:Uncharacterized protein n=1 Tax=Streptantibioticus rubrisoli TaxID=1387313 RepID=A0ABT1P9E1_9ACTN|nr:hypothetical protein [Streptantibioticus rubrisoli]MCQ4041987.1 hypothetical protein [Streptantibioticus rubrisoli]
MVGLPLDSGCVLVSCELCGGLLAGSALRAERHYRLVDEGDVDVPEVATRLVCADVVACYARALRPGEWERLSTWVPIVCEPEDGAPLWMCHLCHVPATGDALSISRVHDEDGWWTVINCADESACDRRQRVGAGLPDPFW